MKTLKGIIFKLIAFMVFFIALLAASDNSEEVSLTFLQYSTPLWPISWWVLAAFVIGVVFASVINSWNNTQLKLAARKANTQVKQTNRELDLAKAGQTNTDPELLKAE